MTKRQDSKIGDEMSGWRTRLTSTGVPRQTWLLVTVSGLSIAVLTTLTVIDGPRPAVLVMQVVLIAAFGLLSLVDLRAAVAIAMLELAIGGASGQWTRLPAGISGRIALDLIVTAAAALTILAERRRTGRWELGRYGLHALALAVTIPAVWMSLGLLQGNRASDVFADGNGHLFLAFTLAFVALMRQGHGSWLRDWFFVVCAANAVVTFFMIAISATGLVGLDTTLRYILTDKLLVGNVVGYQPNGAYRLFLASGLYLQLGLALTTWRLLQRPRSVGYWLLYGLLWADVLATYTRGFWIGSLLAVAIVLVFGARGVRRPALVVAGSGATLVLMTVLTLPFGFSLPEYVLQRTATIGMTDVGTEDDPSDSTDPEVDVAGALANQVRAVQARVLLGHIVKRPILGHGFGSIARDYPYDDIFSYELAYLDLLYKAGIVGLLLFLSLPVRLLIDALRIRYGRLAHPHGLTRHELAVVVSIIVSIGITGATNPYFLAAFGLMPVLVTISWLDSMAPAGTT